MNDTDLSQFNPDINLKGRTFMKRIVCVIMVVFLLFSHASAGTWTCGICEFGNEADNMFCGTCGAERSGWNCEICSVLNDEDAVYCKGCGFFRDKARVWSCCRCGSFNNGRFCTECGHAQDSVLLERPMMLTGAEAVGDIVKFGLYGGDEMEWRVLENDGQALYLLSEYGVDSMPYNEQAGEVTWENSSLRAWLNNEFYFQAFTNGEREHIASFTEMDDFVSLLSRDDIVRYFNVDAYEYGYSENLICMPTRNAVNKGAWSLGRMLEEWQSNYEYPLQYGACWWWLRSSGESADKAGSVGACGDVSKAGGAVNTRDGCVRPIIKVFY